MYQCIVTKVHEWGDEEKDEEEEEEKRFSP